MALLEPMHKLLQSMSANAISTLHHWATRLEQNINILQEIRKTSGQGVYVLTHVFVCARVPVRVRVCVRVCGVCVCNVCFSFPRFFPFSVYLSFFVSLSLCLCVFLSRGRPHNLKDPLHPFLPLSLFSHTHTHTHTSAVDLCIGVS